MAAGSTSTRVLLAALIALAAQPSSAQGDGRVYIRRIEFVNAPAVRDEVLRREMLVFEGGYLDTVALERSRQRLERLPYIEAARTYARPVQGQADVVDVVVELKTAPPRHYGAGFAYSESLGASVQGYLTDESVLGSGQRFAAELDLGDHRSVASLSHTNPAARPDLSRTIALSFRRIDRLADATSPLDAELATARLEYAYRSGEAQQTTLGLELKDTSLTASEGTSDELRDWIRTSGDARDLDGAVNPSTRFSELDFVLRWRHDTRDAMLRPRRGIEQTLGFVAAVPGSEIEYYLLDYELASYHPIRERWTAILRTQLAYGASYGGGTSSLPPYLNRFAGGPGSVRGIRASTLGPSDSLGNPYGGNLLTSAQLEILTPWPRRFEHALRVGVFYDLGNVFQTEGVAFTDPGDRDDFRFDVSDLRHSAGVMAEVQIPFGLLRLSYGVPFERGGDDDHFQVALGVRF